MARPVLEVTAHDAKPHLRTQHWLELLAAMKGEKIDNVGLDSLTQGKRDGGNSLHLLIMDLQKQINHLAKTLASELIDGAHVLATERCRLWLGQRLHARTQPHGAAQVQPSGPGHRRHPK